MSSKVGIIATIVVVVIALFMMFGGEDYSTTDNNKNVATENQQNQVAKTENKEPKDEQSEALEEMKKQVSNVGLSKLYIVKCAACHGRDGKGPVGPSIAGKSLEYNMASLLKYKNGQVENTMMKGLLEKTPIEELEMLAREVSSFK